VSSTNPEAAQENHRLIRDFFVAQPFLSLHQVPLYVYQECSEARYIPGMSLPPSSSTARTSLSVSSPLPKTRGTKDETPKGGGCIFFPHRYSTQAPLNLSPLPSPFDFPRGCESFVPPSGRTMRTSCQFPLPFSPPPPVSWPPWKPIKVATLIHF